MKITDDSDIEKAARMMQKLGAKNVLIKGGHVQNGEVEIQSSDLADLDKTPLVQDRRTATDTLFLGNEKYLFETEYIHSTSTHGTGCTLASAIAANLALGATLTDAIRISKNYVTEAIRTAPKIGSGNGPINHFAKTKAD